MIYLSIIWQSSEIIASLLLETPFGARSHLLLFIHTTQARWYCSWSVLKDNDRDLPSPILWVWLSIRYTFCLRFFCFSYICMLYHKIYMVFGSFVYCLPKLHLWGLLYIVIIPRLCWINKIVLMILVCI